MELTFCAPCLFGLEGIVSDELKRMNIEGVQAQNGRVLFTGGWDTMARANLQLRTAERVLLRLGSFPAPTFDALFEGVKALKWEAFIPKNGAFPVKGYSLNSKLASVPSCQSIIKKAVVERLGKLYNTKWFDENGERHQIQFSLQNDMASIYLDTSGSGLHKRGYRPKAGEAPLRETLAAAMVLLSRYRGGGAFADPFCGSGTIPIEAALIAKNRAPGLGRVFDAQKWRVVPESVWRKAAEAAAAAEYSNQYDIWGGDIDGECVETARENARRAGVGDCVRFERADVSVFRPEEGTVVVTNPPYGERLGDMAAAEAHYKTLARVVPPETKLFALSSHPAFESEFGRKAVKKRKLYNGMIQCYLYMYY